MGNKTYSMNSTFLTEPAGSDQLNQADDEMRKERTVFKEGLAEEHNYETSTTSNNQGTHKQGSAIATVDTSEPAVRPDGVSYFTTALDKGRLHVNTTSGHILEVLKTGNGSGTDTWEEIQANSSPSDFTVGGDGLISGDLTVTGSSELPSITQSSIQKYFPFVHEISLTTSNTYAELRTAILSYLGAGVVSVASALCPFHIDDPIFLASFTLVYNYVATEDIVLLKGLERGTPLTFPTTCYLSISTTSYKVGEEGGYYVSSDPSDNLPCNINLYLTEKV